MNNFNDICPNCKKDLTGDSIPEEYKDLYADGSTHYSNRIGIYSRELDRTTHWKCPYCDHIWERDLNASS